MMTYNSKQMQQNTILKYHVCLDKNNITAADYKTHYDEYLFYTIIGIIYNVQLHYLFVSLILWLPHI